MASGPRMTEFEIALRARQPEELAEQRRKDAKSVITEQKKRDDQAEAKRDRLKLLRLEKEAAEAKEAALQASLAPPPAPAKKRASPARKKAVAAK